MKTRKTPAEIADLVRQNKISPSLIQIWKSHRSDPIKLIRNYNNAVSKDKKVRGDIPRNVAIAVFIGCIALIAGILHGMRPAPVICLTIASGLVPSVIIAIVGKMAFDSLKRAEKELEGFCEYISSLECASELTFSGDIAITMKALADAARNTMPRKYEQALVLKAKEYSSAAEAEKFCEVKTELDACHAALNMTLIETSVTPSMISELDYP